MGRSIGNTASVLRILFSQDGMFVKTSVYARINASNVVIMELIKLTFVLFQNACVSFPLEKTFEKFSKEKELL